jgi:hypothetical protein
MLKFKQTTIFLASAFCLSVPATADLFYDPERSAQLATLIPVESVRQTSEYICGDSALYISAFAATNEINGRHASVTGKIVSGGQSHDISEHLSKSIEGDDLIYRSMSVRCGQNSGAFQVIFSLGKYFKDRPESRTDSTTVEIYSDGFVMGSSSTKRRIKKK